MSDSVDPVQEPLKHKWVRDVPKKPILDRLRDSKIVNAVWSVITQTPVEIAVGALIIGGFVGRESYQYQSLKEGQIPVAFSEIEATQKEFANKGQVVPPLTMFYSATNDTVMKVFEANNEAFENGYDHTAFARALEKKADPEKSSHATIGVYSDEMRGYARDAFASLAKPMDAAQRVALAEQTAGDVWDYYGDDNYRTETYTATEGTGENRRTVTKTRRVYTSTDHRYTYHADQGVDLARQMNRLNTQHPHLNVAESLRYAQRTGGANEEAIRKSMAELFKKKEPTAADFLELANRWASGSAFSKYYPEVRNNFQEVAAFGRTWNAMQPQARSHYYRTSSSFDRGPQEYQVVKNIRPEMREMVEAMNRMTDGIQLSADRIPTMNQNIKQYIGVVLEGKPGDADELRSSIMSDARKVYNANFPGGFDVHPFKWGWVALFTVLGTLAGAGLGTGVDRYIYHFTRNRQPKKEELSVAPVWRRRN